MKIVSIDNKPIDTFLYKNVGGRNNLNPDGSLKIVESRLPIQKGVFKCNNALISTLIVASDLQGNVENEDSTALIGEHLASYLGMLLELEFNIKPKTVGVVLAGDLYATLDKRGGCGDVRKVWFSFRDTFKWVVGVNGNHDQIGENETEAMQFQLEPNIYLLHKQSVEIDKIKISGISGVIGNNQKPNRVDENEYLAALKKMLANKPEFSILHETPDYPKDKFEGNEKIRKVIVKSPKNLVICGHKFWNEPLRVLKNGSQILNANARVIILTKQG